MRDEECSKIYESLEVATVSAVINVDLAASGRVFLRSDGEARSSSQQVCL
jgi:hypothetical protein